MPRIVRRIVYEGTEDQLRKQMEGSLMDGTFPFLTVITVETLSTDVPHLTGKNPQGWQPRLEKNTDSGQTN